MRVNIRCVRQVSLLAKLLLFLLLGGFSWAGGAVLELQPYAENPYYWQFQGQPVLLLGGSSEDNLFQQEEADLIAELDLLQAAGVNYLRNTLSCRDPGNRWPFARQDDNYDLERWDPVFWQRLEIFLRETERRDMVVQIEFWDPFDFHRDNWNNLNPFNPRLNRNYTAGESGLPEDVTTHPANMKFRHPFFRTVLQEEDSNQVLTYQRRLVNKVLDHTLRYSHVLYCISNETTVKPAWGAYWADLIRQRAASAGRRVCITEMWDDWDLRGSQHRATFDHPERYDYVELSQNTHISGQDHADRILWVRQYLAERPRPMNAVKIYGSDVKQNGSEGVARYWRNLFCGMAASRFHRPPGGWGDSEQALRQIMASRRLLSRFDIYRARPASHLLDGREENEAYALAAEKMVAVYFPAEILDWREKPLNSFYKRLGVLKREVTLAGESSGSRRLEICWLTPSDPDFSPWKDLSGEKPLVSPPGDGHWIALIRDKS